MRRKNWPAVAVVTAAVVLFWWRMIFTGQVPVIHDPGYLYEDYFSFIPALELTSNMLKSGQVPLWSPYSQAGMVLFADPQYTITYPLNALCYLLPTQPHFAAVVLAHMLIGAVSLYFLMLRLRVSAAAAIVSSFVYVFSFPVVFGILQINAAWPWHWLPLILLLILSFAETRKRSYLYLLAVIWGLQMFTYVQSTYIMSLIIAPFTLLCLLSGGGRRGFRGFCGAAFWLTLAVLLGTCLAAVFLVPLWEYRSLCSYRQFTYEEASFGSLPPRLALEFLFSAKKCQYGWWALVSYMGVVGILYSLYAVLRNWRNKFVLFFAAAFAVALVMSLGRHTPLYRLFYHHFPGAHFFHHPQRFLQAIPICISILAGLGIERLRAARAARRGGIDTALFGMLFLAFLALYLGKSHGWGPLACVPVTFTALRETVVFSLAVLLLSIAYATGYARQRILVAGLLLLVYIDSCVNTSSLAYFDYRTKYTTPDTVRYLRENAGLWRFITYNKNVRSYPPHFMDEDAMDLIYPELSNFFGVYGVQCRGPLRIRRYEDLVQAINRGHEIVLDVFAHTPRIRDYTSPIIDLLGVKYIVSKGELEPPYMIIHDSYWLKTAGPGETITVEAGKKLRTDAVVLESFLESASRIGQGEEVAVMTLWAGGEKTGRIPIRAGVHTAEGFQLNDAAASREVRHSPVSEAEGWEEITGEGTMRRGSLYRGIVELNGKKEVDRIEIACTHHEGLFRLQRVYYRPEEHREISEGIRRRFLPVFRDRVHDIIIYENTEALPRAFLVNSVETVPSPGAALKRLMGGKLDLARSIIIEGELPSSHRGRTPESARAGEVEILSYLPNRIEMRARAEEECFLFLSDAHYPGWETLVDGEKIETYHADYLFRAAAVPAGEHEVVMRFRPASFLAGGLASILVAAIIAAGFLAECIIRKKARR